MKIFIHQSPPKLIIFFMMLFMTSSSQANSAKHLKSYKRHSFYIAQNKITVYVADSIEKQRKGLSLVKDKDFQNDEAVFFPGKRMSLRQFWMPHTYFNIDLLFLDSKGQIIDIHRDLTHSPRKIKKAKIPTSKEVYSQHVLEMKASSKLAKKLKIGMKINFLNHPKTK